MAYLYIMTIKQYGIIGYPLGHTMSPTLHNWGFEQFGLQAKYEAWPTPPDALDAFMTRFKKENYRGLSVTIPHKLTIMEYVDALTDRAQAVGAVNTLWWDNDTLMGDNTDVAGAVNPLRLKGGQLNSALILGAGGASRAAVAGCKELGIETISISNRTASKAAAIATDFAINTVDWDKRQDETPDLIINSTPLGMQGDLQSQTPWPFSFASTKIVFDLVYNPLETRLLQEAAQAGCETIQGLEMFVHQGLEQFRLWTGKALDLDGARNLVLEQLRY